MYEVMSSDSSPKPDKTLMNESLRREIERSLSTLTPREADVIRLYFGLSGKHPMTLEEIGEKFDLTRERVRQIKEKSIRIFKTSLIESNSNAPAGTVILRSKNKLLVASGQGVIGIDELQADAKKKMPISEFLNGFNIRKGDLFC